MDGFNFENELLSNNICESNEKMCGGKYYERKFCVKSNLKCPINNLSF